MPELSHLVLPEEDGWRVTRIIRDTLQVSSSQFKSARWNGQLLVDGQPAYDNVLTKQRIFFINDETVQFTSYPGGAEKLLQALLPELFRGSL